ncbi:50S ribosomal protein L24 [Thalassoroseus pseudoceratinae]|uniref:50S ribosomal protein L24 n=1 Tax=Thalassoroseus pseudoceratinae TaxID=2713176 RepID=UPI001420985A|nr:50S ribosomal protein L24 [Thalassoroseus pseudoceratinae]
MKIQRGDSVIVIAGDSASSTPRSVVQVLDGGKRLVVEGINRAVKHVKRGHPKSPQGGQLQIERPIEASNVMLYCQSCSQATRVGLRYTEDGSKERFCKKCDASAGTISPPRARYAKKS